MCHKYITTDVDWHNTAKHSTVQFSCNIEKPWKSDEHTKLLHLLWFVPISRLFFVPNWTLSLVILNTVSFHQNTTIGKPNTSRLLLLHLIYLSPVFCVLACISFTHAKNLKCKYICTHKSTSFRTNLWSNFSISTLFSLVS